MKIRYTIFMMSMISGCAVVGCGAAHDSDVVTPVVLVPWEGQYQALFDDSIDPVAVGLSLDGRKAEEEPMLRARTLTAESIVQFRIQTVTADSIGAKTTYVLGLKALAPPLWARKSSPVLPEVLVTRQQPAFGIVHSMTSTLRGKSFLGFFRPFKGRDGLKMHWHFTADTEAVRTKVENIVALEALVQE